MEIMIGMQNPAWAINEESQKHILKHCNKIIELFTNESKPMQTEDMNTTNIKKNIEKQPRFFTKNKNNKLEFHQLSTSEGNIIRKSLLHDVVNVHSYDDHS